MVGTPQVYTFTTVALLAAVIAARFRLGNRAIAIDKTTFLDSNQLSDVEHHLEHARFWDSPTKDGHDGLDGDQLIVEGVLLGAVSDRRPMGTRSGVYAIVPVHTRSDRYKNTKGLGTLSF